MQALRHFNQRNILFVLFSIIAFLMLYPPLRDLLNSSPQSEYYSHIILIPFVSAYFIYLKRTTLFENAVYSYGAGAPLLAIAAVLFLAGRTQGAALNQNDYTSLITLSAIIFWAGTFIFLHGPAAFRAAMFPLLLLVFMIPIPSFLLDKAIFLLQVGSTGMSYLLFKLSGTPFSQEGFVFNLPGISIEVARQCSGIRSSIALLITSILAAHLFLQTGWKKAVLVLSAFPVAIFKNAVRIVVISLLSVYVDERFLTESFLHKSGGFLFYALGLAILGLILWLLKDRGSPSLLHQDDLPA